jgi:hypothetical protein
VNQGSQSAVVTFTPIPRWRAFGAATAASGEYGADVFKSRDSAISAADAGRYDGKLFGVPRNTFSGSTALFSAASRASFAGE